MKNLKQRYHISSNKQLLVILLVFALTGSSAALVSKPILAFFGITKATVAPALYYLFYALLIFPVYQVLLVTIGALFGQFTYFIQFEIKMLRRLQLHFIANYIEQKLKN